MTTWNPPGAGQWKRDEVHLPKGMTGFTEAILVPAQLAGFRRGFAEYGAMIDGFDTAKVGGRLYMRPRIVGAPPMKIWGENAPAKIPGPGKPPPVLIMKLLFKLHPELRRRARRAADVWATRPWRETVRRWFDSTRGERIAKNRDLTQVDIATLDDAALAGHLELVADNFTSMCELHFVHAPMATVVVGDYLARAMAWSSATAMEVLSTLQGASPASRAGATETKRIADVLATSRPLRAIVESDQPPAAIVAALRADRGDVGRLVRDYLEAYGLRPIDGLDIYHQHFDEVPELFVRSLRSALTGAAPPPDRADAAFAALRTRTPEAHHAELEDAYNEARLVYSVRDDDVGVLLWCLGLVHRAVREAGRRLAARGAIEEQSHAYETTHLELPALLRKASASVPSGSELKQRSRRRLELETDPPPVVLGEPSPMPGEKCFPPAVVRMQRAVMSFLATMDGNHGREAGADAVVRGTPVSAGTYEGRARIVRTAEDFRKIDRGDVLIAISTSPAYNVLLPLLGAIVTERGGLLSHAAIVAREYGVPGIVDTRNAMSRIPDGAIVRVDGASGEVTIVRAPDASVRAPDASVRPADGVKPRPAAPMVEPTTAGQGVALCEATTAEFGGKAKALAAALTAKLPVPDGIALDADLVARVVRGEAAARQRVTAALGSLPAPWAVRSSAIGEDGVAASFAGQHATVLGVAADRLFDAIAEVHASAFSEAAHAYRERMGIAGAPRMGIVIQTLLRPETSGVLFSRDPSAMREGRVIEATWGLGEALVSGLVTPDRYRVRADGTILERAIADKDLAIEARADGGTAEVEIRGDRARAACLDDARIAELAQLASRCEALFGGPQDLEWAVANGRLHLLQSRPVTTSAR